MTTSEGPDSKGADKDGPRRSGSTAAQWLLGLLVLLAVVASVLMVFTDDLTWLAALAVIAALWAAAIGAILVTRYRRQAEDLSAKAGDLRHVYELQLEREIAARRQYELDIENNIRKELVAESNTELAELQAQVWSLRASLEELLGHPLPEAPAALFKGKTPELGAGFSDFSVEETVRTEDRAAAAEDFAATAPETPPGRHVPSEDLTEIIPVIEELGEDETDYYSADYPSAYDAPAAGYAREVTGEYVDDEPAEPAQPVAEEYQAADYLAEEYRAGEYRAGEYGVAEEQAAEYEVDEYQPEAYGESAQTRAEEYQVGDDTAADSYPHTAYAEVTETTEAISPEPAYEPAADDAASEAEAPEDAIAESEFEDDDEDAPAGRTARRRRRRDGDHAEGVPVADLLRQLRGQNGGRGN